MSSRKYVCKKIMFCFNFCIIRYPNNRYAEEGRAGGKRGASGGGAGGFQAEAYAEVSLNEFRTPRDTLLCIIAHYYCHTTTRMRELRKIIADPGVKATELLDPKAHNVRELSSTKVEMR